MGVLASAHPPLIPEFMEYVGTIVRASQDFAGLAWVRYDTSFRCQAAQTGHRRWSQLNPTLGFTGNAQKVARCELCLGFTHTAVECALRGEACGIIVILVKILLVRDSILKYRMLTEP